MSTKNKCMTDKCGNESATWAINCCEPCAEASMYQGHLEQKLRELGVVAFRCGHFDNYFHQEPCNPPAGMGCWECTMGTSQCIDCWNKQEQEMNRQQAEANPYADADPWF